MLYEIFKKHKFPIAATYTIFGVEFLIFAMLPYVLGLAVDSLLQHKNHTFKMYIGACLIGMCTGFFRRRIDTRVFSKIWSKDTARAIDRMIEADVEPSSIVSRSGYVRTYATFFEYSLPSVISSVMNIFVSIFMIWIVALLGGVVSTVAMFVSLCTCYIYSCKSQALELKMQAVNEGIDGCIIQKDIEGVEAGYDLYKNLYIKNSDLDAINWGLMDFISVSCEVIVVLTVVSNGHTVGTIMATISYTNRLFERIEVISQFFYAWKQVEIANKLLGFGAVDQREIATSAG